MPAQSRFAGNIAEGNRVALVNDLVHYAKNYMASSEFKTAFQQYQDRRSEPVKKYLPSKPQAKTMEAIIAVVDIMI